MKHDAKKSNKKKPKNRGTKKNKSMSLPTSVMSEKQIMEEHIQEHSRAMTPIFEELGPMLKDVHNRLNDLMLLESPPKTESNRTRIRDVPQAVSTSIPVDDCSSGKAGKLAFPVLDIICGGGSKFS